jgi:DNA-directed RNA polymerase subunit RPC12/RpoP
MSEPTCTHTEVEPDYVRTDCGSFYSTDSFNEFIYCPYCSKEISDVEE